MKWLKMTVLILIVVAMSCSNEGGGTIGGGNNGTPDNNNDPLWAIPQTEVFDGGPGKDGIPALSNPNFVTVEVADEYMTDEDLIIGVKVGNEIRGYTHPVLDWHEIINDELGDEKFALTYCPLTGTGIRWNRVLDGEETTFGVSGLLYNTNLIPYDRATDSNWSQMRNDCVNGEFRGDKAELQPIVELDWKTWKLMFPDALVTSTVTGHSRNYGSYPYGNYRTNHDYLIFPISPDDDRLDRKERVLGIEIGGDVRVYRFSSFELSEIRVVQDIFKGENVVVVGSSEHNFMVAYNRVLPDGTQLNFIPQTSLSETVMLDNEGNQWNVFGEAVIGPRMGQRLQTYDSYMGYWLAWGSFYPDCDIFQF